MSSFYVFLVIASILTSGYLLNLCFGSHETRILQVQVSALSDEMGQLMDKGRELGNFMKRNVFVKDNNYRMILQLDTLPVTLRAAGTGGSATGNAMASQDDLTYQVQDVINSLNNQLQVQSGSYREIYKKAMEYSAGCVHLPAIQPVAQKDLTMISSDFGVRSDPFFFTSRVHYGLDFVAPEGKNVYATGDGIVTFIEHSRTGYGNEIVIDHKFGFGSRYAHLQKISVTEGEHVKRGQVIGTVGETGRATGPHLHYEVLYDHHPVNPSFYFDTSLTREEFAQIINRANTKN